MTLTMVVLPTPGPPVMTQDCFSAPDGQRTLAAERERRKMATGARLLTYSFAFLIRVEETLNALLDAEADRLCNAQRYERSEARRAARAGHYERDLQTKAGGVRLKVPKLRGRRSRRPSSSAISGARAQSKRR